MYGTHRHNIINDVGGQKFFGLKNGISVALNVTARLYSVGKIKWMICLSQTHRVNDIESIS